jgi:hypothetical protein
VAAGDLTTLADVRQFVGKPSDSAEQTEDDALLMALIAQASKAIHRYTGREFASTATDPATRVFAYHGGGRLYLTPYDLRSVTSVQIDTESDNPFTLTADADYFLFPRNAPDGVYEWLELHDLEPASKTSANQTKPWREVEITGTWGFESVPDDVKLAANMQVAFLWRQHSTVPGNDLAGEGDRFGPVNLCSGAMQLLAPYRVVSFGHGA